MTEDLPISTTLHCIFRDAIKQRVNEQLELLACVGVGNKERQFLVGDALLRCALVCMEAYYREQINVTHYPKLGHQAIRDWVEADLRNISECN